MILVMFMQVYNEIRTSEAGRKTKTYSLERKSTRKLKITAKACAGREAIAVKAISLQREVPFYTIIKGKTSPS